MRTGARTARLLALATLLSVATAAPAQDFADVVVRSEPVAGNVHVITGKGGNVGVLTGADGNVLIDDQYAPLSERILATLAALDSGPVRFVINTHWHGDHSGGNENMSGAGALIVAHDNVRRRLSSEQFIAAFGMRSPARPKEALPVVTFAESIRLHLNGETLNVQHAPRGHTDGDAFIVFETANVIHTGDLWFHGTYPFIDASTGGTVAGVLAAIDRILALADARTRIIPGHGPVGGRDELAASRAMIAAASQDIAALKSRGLSREAVIAAAPVQRFDATCGNGFLNGQTWTGIIYDAIP